MNLVLDVKTENLNRALKHVSWSNSSINCSIMDFCIHKKKEEKEVLYYDNTRACIQPIDCGEYHHFVPDCDLVMRYSKTDRCSSTDALLCYH